MKKTRKLIPAIAMLLMSTVMMSTASFAWFSIGNTATVDGMKVRATASGSLVISDSMAVAGATKVIFAAAEKELMPVTYIDNTYKYVTNTQNIDPATGLVNGSNADITSDAMTEVVLKTPDAGNSDSYYKDYIVYLAAAGSAATIEKLTATVTWDTATYTQLAATVAFTVLGEVTGVVGDQAVASTQAAKVAASQTQSDSVDVDLTVTSLPLNTDSKAVAVLMRVYFDGALKEGDGKKTYVRSEQVNLAAIGLKVVFTAVNMQNVTA